ECPLPVKPLVDWIVVLIYLELLSRGEVSRLMKLVMAALEVRYIDVGVHQEPSTRFERIVESPQHIIILLMRLKEAEREKQIDYRIELFLIVHVLHVLFHKLDGVHTRRPLNSRSEHL